MKLQNPKTGELIDIQDEDGARDEAIAKGYTPIVAMRNPKTKEIYHIDDREVGEAIKKGYEYDTGDRDAKILAEGERKRASMTDSTVKGAYDAASGGWKDELAGAVEAVGSKVGIRGLGTAPLGQQRFETDEEDKQSFADVYSQGRDVVRDQNKTAKAANLGSYKLGEMAGGIVSGIATAPYTMGIGGAIKEGVVRGLGESEGDIGTQVKDAAVGGALSGALAYGMPKVIDKANAGVDKARNWAGKTFFGVEADATEAYLKDPAKFGELIKRGKEAQNELMDKIDDAYKTYVSNPTKEAEANLTALKSQLGEAQDMEKEAFSRYKSYMQDRTKVGEDTKYALDDAYDKTLNQPIRDAEAKVGELSGKLGEAKGAARQAEDRYVYDLKNARPDGEMAGSITKMVDEIGAENSKASSEAFKILQDEQVQANPQEVIDAVTKRMKQLEIAGAAPSLGEDLTVYNKLKALRDSAQEVSSANGVYTGEDIKKVVKGLRDEGYSKDTSFGARKKFREAGSELDADILKGRSPAYAQKMGELAPDTKLHIALSDYFDDPVQAERAIKAAMDPNNAQNKTVRTLIQSLDAKKGTNMLAEIDKAAAARQLAKSPDLAGVLAGLPENKAVNELSQQLGSSSDLLQQARDKEAAFKLLRQGSSEKSLQSIVNGKSIEARDALDEFGNVAGHNFMDDLQPHIDTRNKLNDPEFMDWSRNAAPETPELAKLKDVKGQTSKAEELLAQLKEQSKGFDRLKDTKTEGLLQKLKRGTNGTEKASRELENLSQKAGVDFNSQVDDLAIADQFLKDRTAGSRNVNMMATIGGGIGTSVGGALGGFGGAGIGGTIGAGAGAMVGKNLDQAGGAIWRSILDKGIKVAPYRKMFDEAMKSGPARVAMLHMLLSKNDPKYAEMMAEQ